MEIELGDEILNALTMLAKCSRRAGLSNVSETLDDAVILVFNSLCADRSANKALTIDGSLDGCKYLH